MLLCVKLEWETEISGKRGRVWGIPVFAVDCNVGYRILELTAVTSWFCSSSLGSPVLCVRVVGGGKVRELPFESQTRLCFLSADIICRVVGSTVWEKKTMKRQNDLITQEVFSYSLGHCSNFCSVGVQRWVEKGVEGIWRGKWKIFSTIIRFNDPANPWVLAALTPAVIVIHRRRFALIHSFVKHAGQYAITLYTLFKLSKSLR